MCLRELVEYMSLVSGSIPVHPYYLSNLFVRMGAFVQGLTDSNFKCLFEIRFYTNAKKQFFFILLNTCSQASLIDMEIHSLHFF